MRLTRGGADRRRGSRRTSSTRASGTRASRRPAASSFDPFPSTGFAGDVAKAKPLMREGRLPERACTPGPQVTHGRRQHAARLEHRPGRRGRPGQDRDQGSRRSRSRTRRCTRGSATCRRTSRTSARTSGGCPTSTSRRRSSTSTFNGKNITPVEQLELAAPERPEHQRGHGQGRADRSTPRPATRPGARSTSRSTQHGVRRSRGSGSNYPTLFSTRVTPAPERLERRRPGRDLHGGQVAGWRSRSRLRPAGVRPGRRLRALPARSDVVDAALHRPPRSLWARLRCSSSSAR